MSIRFKKGFYILILILVVLAGGLLYMKYADRDAPVVSIAPEKQFAGTDQVLTLRAKDQGLGLKSVQIKVMQNDAVVLEETEQFSDGVQEFETELELPDLDQGEFTVVVSALDRSIINWGKGNTTEYSRSMIYDSLPPSVSVLSTAHNLNQGGAGLIIYSVSDDAVQSGVRVADSFFPGFEQPDGNYYCMFSFPYDANPDTDIPRITAVDKAGNERVTGFYYHVNAREFRSDRLNISDNFLRSQMPQFESDFPEIKEPLEIFLAVNSELRRINRNQVREIAEKTDPALNFSGRFSRLENSAQMSGFGDYRTYYYQGEEIDRQRHVGVDLASTAQAPVQAANRGRVVFTGNIGIYGQTVVLDHGLGLQTLYAHLSSINVAEGDLVEKGHTLGRTGTTGLAVGDHLHFEVLVSGTSVNPVEWWDATWIQNNITSKLPG